MEKLLSDSVLLHCHCMISNQIYYTPLSFIHVWFCYTLLCLIGCTKLVPRKTKICVIYLLSAVLLASGFERQCERVMVVCGELLVVPLTLILYLLHRLLPLSVLLTYQLHLLTTESFCPRLHFRRQGFQFLFQGIYFLFKGIGK